MLRHSSYHHLIFIFLHFGLPVTTVKLAYLHIVLYNLQYIALSCSSDLYPLSVVFSASVPPCHAGCRPGREKPNIGGSFYNTVAD